MVTWGIRVMASATAAVLVAGASSALAGVNSHLDAKIKPLSSGKLSYQGKVRSSSDACVPDRKIKITAHGARIGRAKTDEDGRFSLVGKSVKSGTKVTFSLQASGIDCIALELHAPAP